VVIKTDEKKINRDRNSKYLRNLMDGPSLPHYRGILLFLRNDALGKQTIGAGPLVAPAAGR